MEDSRFIKFHYHAIMPGKARTLHRIFKIIETPICSGNHRRNFVVKWGDSLVWNQHSHRVDAEVTFCICRFPIIFLEVFWEQHLSLCFVLADDIFLAHFRFLKNLQIFLMLLDIMHAAPPCQNLHWHPLTSSKNIWPKISVAYFRKWFQSFVLLVGGGCILSISPCWPLPAYPHRVVKGLILKPEPGSSPTFIFEARFRPESQIYQGT